MKMPTLSSTLLAGGSLLAAAFLMGVHRPASAQVAPYPSRPIITVVPQAPAGGADSAARVLMQKLSTALGQPVVVENRAGAGGMIGTRHVAKAPNDGYTLLFTSSSHSINPAINTKAGYDPIKDFTPIALLAQAPFVLVAHPGFEAKSAAELIAMAKKAPGRIDYGSVGVGSFNHLLGEMLIAGADIKLQHVPFKGSAEAASAVVGGQIPISFNSLAATLPFIRSGKLRALAVTTPHASPLAPDIPPLSTVVPGYDGTTWFGIMAPAGTPKAIVDRLSAEIQTILRDPAVEKSMAQMGLQTTYRNSDEMRGFLALQSTSWSNIIKRSGIPLVE